MSVRILGEKTLGEINVAASASIPLMAPALAQLDLAIFGLGGLEADIAAQFNAALSAEVSFGLQMSNPFEALQQAFQAAIQIQASIVATLALGLPVVSAEVGVSLSASAAISAALAVKLGGIQALISAALAVKFPAVNFLGDLAGRLAVGPIVLLSFSDPTDTLRSVGGQIDSLFSGGIVGIGPDERVYGLVLVTTGASAWGAMQATLQTA